LTSEYVIHFVNSSSMAARGRQGVDLADAADFANEISYLITANNVST